MATSPRSAAIRDWGSPMTPGVRVVKREPKKIFIYLSIYLSIYLYCVTLIAEYYAQGCRRWRKARAYLDIPGIYMWNHRCRKATAKPHTLRRMFFFFFFFFFFHINILSSAGLEPVQKRYMQLGSKVQLSYSGASYRISTCLSTILKSNYYSWSTINRD